jgi:hypothetical protein
MPMEKKLWNELEGMFCYVCEILMTFLFLKFLNLMFWGNCEI